MPTLVLPKIFINKVDYQEIQDNRLVSKSRTVESPTSPIAVDFSGLGQESYSAEALKTKRRLELAPGETKEFTPDEAKFLKGIYPFIQDFVEEVKAPEVQPQAPILGMSGETIPVNFMQLKAYVASKGIEVSKTDKKEDLMRKLAQK